MEIPIAYQEDWETINKELEDASIELNEANKRYHLAIEARIAIVALIRNIKD